MLTRILVALDGSALAERALPVARRFGEKSGSEILLFRAHAPDLHAALDAAGYVRRVEQDLQKDGLQVRARVRSGEPATLILETAAEERADLIAMTTHGRTGLPRWAFGSVAEKVLRAASIPLFVGRAFAPGSAFAQILMPCDGSPLSRAILPHVVALARIFESRVLALRVAEPHEARHEAEGSLQRTVSALAAEGVAAVPFLRDGDPAQEILDVAQAHGADLIAMSTRGRSGLSRWTFGSVAEKVLRAGSTPMLVLPGREVAPVLVEAAESCWKE